MAEATQRLPSSIFLLIWLYVLQGAALGLAYGTMPFLLNKYYNLAELTPFGVRCRPPCIANGASNPN